MTTTRPQSATFPRGGVLILLALTLLGGATGAATEAAAQAPAEAPVRWEGEGELSFISTTGNASTRSLGTFLQLQHRPGAWELLAKGAFARNSAEGETNAESLTGLTRAARALGARMQAFGELEYLKNRFAGIDHRYSPEVGATLEVLTEETQSLRLLGGIGLVHEVRTTAEDRTFASANTRVAYRWQLTPTAELTNEGGLTLNLDDTDDWRLANRAALRLTVSEIFSVRISHTLEHLNQPVPGFVRTDGRTSVALVAAF